MLNNICTAEYNSRRADQKEKVQRLQHLNKQANVLRKKGMNSCASRITQEIEKLEKELNIKKRRTGKGE